MDNDPYAGLFKPVTPTTDKDPYAGLIRELTPTTAPVPRRTLLETGVEAVGSAIPSALQFGKGLYEAVTNPVQTAGSLLDVGAGALYLGANEVLPKQVMDFVASMDDPEATQRAVDAAKQFGGMMAYRYGSADKIKNTIATDPVGFAADFSTILSGGASAAGRLGTLGREVQIAQRANAVAGAPSAAAISRAGRNFARNAEIVANKLSRGAELTNPMNALRPVGRGITKIAGKAPLAIANMMSPKSAAYMDVAEGRGNELIQQLRDPQNVMVPGSMPTTAEAASPLGLTKFSAMGDAAAKAAPSEYFTRGAEQEAARLAGIRSVGRTPEDLAALQKGRKETGRMLYGNIEKNVVNVDDTFRALTQRPSMDKAMKRAAEISAEQGVPFQIGPDIRPGSMAGMVTEGKPAQYTVQSLHNLKTAMDDIIKDPATFGIGANEARLMGRTRDNLIKWIESKEPGYKTARQTFAKQSRRINQTEVGQFLEGKLTSALSDVAERANVFGAAVKEAPTTIKRALTGESRYRQLTDLLDPQQIEVIEAVRSDLARKATTKIQAQKGAAAAPRVGQLAKQTGEMPQFLNRVATVANTIFNRLQGRIDRKLAIEIAAEMIDPKAAAAALEKAMVRQELANATGRGAAAAAKAGGKVLTSRSAKVGGQFQNVMTQAQNRNAMAQNQFPQVNEEGAPLISIEYATDEEGYDYAYPVYGFNPIEARAWEKKYGRKLNQPPFKAQ